MNGYNMGMNGWNYGWMWIAGLALIVVLVVIFRARRGNRDKDSGRLLCPPTPPDKQVRIRRLDELIHRLTAQRPDVQRTQRRWWFRCSSSSMAGFTRFQFAQAQPEG